MWGMHGPLLHGLNLVSNFGCGIIDIGPILRCSTTSLKSSFTRTSIAPNAVLSPQKYHRIFAPCDSSHLKRSFARESTKRTLRAHSEHTQRTLREHSEHIQRTLRAHPKLTRSSGWGTWLREVLKKKPPIKRSGWPLGSTPPPPKRSGKCKKFSTSCHIWGYFAIL